MPNYLSPSLMAADIKNPTFDHPLQKISQNPLHQLSLDHHPQEGSKDFQYCDHQAKEAAVSSSSTSTMNDTAVAVDQEEEPGKGGGGGGGGSGKLFRHWNEVAGRVCIPEKWGQESLLKDWMDYKLFDALLAPKEVVSAREALVAERKRETTRQLIEMERMF